jgi:hypothetical protein
MCSVCAGVDGHHSRVVGWNVNRASSGLPLGRVCCRPLFSHLRSARVFSRHVGWHHVDSSLANTSHWHSLCRLLPEQHAASSGLLSLLQTMHLPLLRDIFEDSGSNLSLRRPPRSGTRSGMCKLALDHASIFNLAGVVLIVEGR